MADDATVKGSTSIHNIPEDVAEIIADLIKGWAVQAKGTEDHRKAGRRARDSTLVGISQSCQKGRHLYQDHLLQNLTVSRYSSLPLSQMFRNGNINGLKVKTLLCALEPKKEKNTSTYKKRFNQIIQIHQSLFPWMDKPRMESVENEAFIYLYGLKLVMQAIYGKLEDLQILIIEDPLLCFHLLTRVENRFIPQPFLTKSLRKLYFCGSKSNTTALSAKNVILLLLFGKVLEKVAIGFHIDRESFHYLSEYASTFEGLSKVKELAISVHFIYEEQDSGSWWGRPSINRGRNRKTEALYDFLLVTSQLSSLEIFDITPGRSGDSALVDTDCLSSLARSINSLTHLRFFLPYSSSRPLAECLHPFKNLANLSLELLGLSHLYKSGQMTFPSSVSTIWLSHYNTAQAEERFSEEGYLKLLLDSVASGALTRVVVPELPIDYKGEVIEERPNWLENRKELENSVIFKEDKVKLIKYRVGDVVGPDCKENPISMYRWLSP